MSRAGFRIHVGRRAAGAVVAAAVVSLTAIIGIAQNPPSAANGSYKVPRTADGHPDLQGYWTNLTYTPFERPRALANKPFYTEQEAKRRSRKPSPTPPTRSSIT